MASAGAKKKVDKTQPLRAALTPEARQNQMVALAMDVAEEQLRNGTASAQVITHFLKLGTEQAKLEMKKIEHENKLLEAKTKAIDTTAELKDLYENALKAMTDYRLPSDEDE